MDAERGVSELFGWAEWERTTSGGHFLGEWLTIWNNDGDGWTESYRTLCVDEGGTYAGGCGLFLAGYRGDALVLWGRDPGAGLLVAGSVSPWPEFSATPAELVLVRDDLAYAIWDDDVVHFDGISWSRLPSLRPADVSRLWADNDDVFAAGHGGTVMSLDGGSWRVHDVGTLSDITAIWGFDGDDVFAAGRNGELLV
ncbi:MAG: hypothetical protein HY905_13690 [Deltaproteobacteria bacterium]|nr:hypothetical protein [Deltaproteobacteria bacterium]